MDFIPVGLVIAAAVQFSCQIFKLFYYSIRDRKLDFGYLVTPGGMPSAHSAFATSITTVAAVRSGLQSEIFAVSAVFAAIIIYDALRLRGAVQEHAVRLNKIQEKLFPGENQEKLSEMVGHSAGEILVGIAFALVVALPLSLLSLRWFPL